MSVTEVETKPDPPATTDLILADSVTALSLPPNVRALATKASTALARTDHATKIWTHSRSGMMLRNMTIGGEYSLLRQMRQVAAELQRKKQAMVEAKYNVLKRKANARLKKREADEEQDPLKKELLDIEAEELAVMSTMVEQPYIGAMREVVELARLHDALEEKIREKYGKLDEEVFEREEAKYWVRRGFAQSLRDMRQSGIIGAGNQELLEQIGLDPLIVKAVLMDFLKSQQASRNPSSAAIEKFLDDCADAYHEASMERVKRLGLPCEVETEHLMLEESEEQDASA